MMPRLESSHSLPEAATPDTALISALPVAWLRGLRLEQYAPAFRDNDVDGEVLPELTADDLISIGVTRGATP